MVFFCIQRKIFIYHFKYVSQISVHPFDNATLILIWKKAAKLFLNKGKK